MIRVCGDFVQFEVLTKSAPYLSNIRVCEDFAQFEVLTQNVPYLSDIRVCGDFMQFEVLTQSAPHHSLLNLLSFVRGNRHGLENAIRRGP